jgi:hypothetical protein
MPRPGFSQPSDIIAAYTVAVYPFHSPPYGQIAQLTDEGAGFCQMRALRVLSHWATPLDYARVLFAFDTPLGEG